MPHILPALPFSEEALEPYIGVRTMQLHHQHHGIHVEGLNKALSRFPAWDAKSAGELLSQLGEVPLEIRRAVRHHAGGHHNHTLFWSWLAPPMSGTPHGPLAEDLAATFGSFAVFRDQFSAAAAGVMGSGWAWLVLHDVALEIVTTANQDSPLLHGKVPLLGLDVWEHAYCLGYGNRRRDYIAAWWNVVNWSGVTREYLAARAAAGHWITS